MPPESATVQSLIRLLLYKQYDLGLYGQPLIIRINLWSPVELTISKDDLAPCIQEHIGDT